MRSVARSVALALHALTCLAALVAMLGAAKDVRADRGSGVGGYEWVDCREADGPACDFVSIATSDGSTGLCSEEVYFQPLGFSFPFYGIDRTGFSVSANGVVYFSGAPGCCDDANAPLSGIEGAAFVAPLWDDWAMDNLDTIVGLCSDPGCSNSGFDAGFVESYQTGTGTDGGVAFRDIEWFSTAHHRPTCTEDFGEQATFAVRLYEDGRILFQYEDTDLGLSTIDHGASATIGITSGFDGAHAEVSFETAFIPSNPFAILFTPTCPDLTCDAIEAQPAEACAGEEQTFTLTTTGGVPPLTVTWDFDGDAVPDATGNPVATILPAGLHSVSAEATDSCATVASCTLTSNVVVHPLPAPTVTALGATTFCAAEGESVVLETEAAASYQWLHDGTPVAGATGMTHEATVSGSWVVRVSDANGCIAESEPIVIDADNCPVGCAELACLSLTHSPEPACLGEAQTFTLSFAGGEGDVLVEWDVDGDGTPDIADNPLRVVLGEGVHEITAVATDSCADPGPQACSRATTATVVAPPVPEVSALGATSFCAAEGEIVVLETDPAWASFQWRRDGADVSGATGSQVVARDTGAWTVVVSDAAGCAGESEPLPVNADDCAPECVTLSCGSVTVDPAEVCAGEPQSLSIDVTGGDGAFTVEWDIDGDGAADATGNPAEVVLPAGSHAIDATVTDSCADPGPQQCTGSGLALVRPGPETLSEVSGPGAPPLLVTEAGEAVTVRSDPNATGYHLFIDVIGSWYAPVGGTGTRCAVASWADNGDGTITFAEPLPGSSWVVVTSAHACGAGPAGADFFGARREDGGDWSACGAAP